MVGTSTPDPVVSRLLLQGPRTIPVAVGYLAILHSSSNRLLGEGLR